MTRALYWRLTATLALAALAAGCGSEKKPAAGEATQAETQPPEEPPSATMDTTITPALIALGDSVFHGQVAGGTCFTCHGPDAKGTQTCPNLTDGEWLHGDGSYTFIMNTVRTGVAPPKKYPAPMPPMGGAVLSPLQIRAVAAYVYSLSHRTG